MSRLKSLARSTRRLRWQQRSCCRNGGAHRCPKGGRARMTPELDGSLETEARLVAELPAAIALFDRDRRYLAASPAWIDAFALAPVALAGRRHDEVCIAGRAALEHVQRHALAGESLDGQPLAGTPSTSG